MTENRKIASLTPVWFCPTYATATPGLRETGANREAADSLRNQQ